TRTSSFVLMCYPFPSLSIGTTVRIISRGCALSCLRFASLHRASRRPLLPAGSPCVNSSPFFGCFRFLDTGPAEDISDHVVALVTRRLIHGPFCFRPRNFRGPRLLPGGGIFDRECVDQSIVRGARETFDEMQFFAGSSKWRAIREIRGVDHQRITLPMSYRVPSQEADVLRNMRTAIGGDNARQVIRLMKQTHVSRPLHNLQEVAFVGTGQHRDL